VLGVGPTLGRPQYAGAPDAVNAAHQFTIWVTDGEVVDEEQEYGPSGESVGTPSPAHRGYGKRIRSSNAMPTSAVFRSRSQPRRPD
jgi:hypothetical protein